jgi:hypothetical protein
LASDKVLPFSAGYGREAVKMPVYMPWPQSGRMQYEKIKSKASDKEFG